MIFRPTTQQGYDLLKKTPIIGKMENPYGFTSQAKTPVNRSPNLANQAGIKPQAKPLTQAPVQTPSYISPQVIQPQQPVSEPSSVASQITTNLGDVLGKRIINQLGYSGVNQPSNITPTLTPSSYNVGNIRNNLINQVGYNGSQPSNMMTSLPVALRKRFMDIQLSGMRGNSGTQAGHFFA